jgi:phenylacetate-CoA ligase
VSYTTDHDQAVAQALDRATRLVPFYRSRGSASLDPALPAAARLAAMPVLRKRDLRTRSHTEFVSSDRTVATGISQGDVEIVTTSGTTEDRVSIVWHQPWWDLSERESLQLNAHTCAIPPGTVREAVLTTPLCTGAICHTGDVPREERTLGRLLFLNQKNDPAFWTEADIARMADEINAFQPAILEADPAYLAQFCYRAIRSGLRINSPRHVILTYEFPSRLHLRQIRRQFDFVPISSYGSTETGHVFMQCEHGWFHENTTTCHVDFQRLVRSSLGDNIGRLLITTLGNDWFALIRFDVGDLARMATAPCPCGRRAGLTMASMEGRVRDVTFTLEGQVVTVNALDRALGEVPGLLAYQVEQLAPAEFLLRFVAEPGLELPAADTSAQALEALYGAGAAIATQRETAIVPEPSGKYCLSRTHFAWDADSLFA